MAEDGGAKARALMAKLYELACAGDVQAARLYMETIQGRPTQALEHSGDVGGITKIIFEREVAE